MFPFYSILLCSYFTDAVFSLWGFELCFKSFLLLASLSLFFSKLFFPVKRCFPNGWSLHPPKNDVEQKSWPQALGAWAGLVDRRATWLDSKAVRAQSCPTLRDPLGCSPLGSSVCGVFQTRILEWVSISSSRGTFLTQRSNSRLLRLLPCRRILYHWATGRPPVSKAVIQPKWQLLWTFPVKPVGFPREIPINFFPGKGIEGRIWPVDSWVLRRERHHEVSPL